MSVHPGQRWTFVDSSEKRTEYVVVDPSDPAQMAAADKRRFNAHWEPDGLIYLLNEATGKYAMVTSSWLHGRVLKGHSHWLPEVES